jgi:2-hydroxy-3-keto-5-methylthiopentenyl-1-phosphate phosphatase
MDPPNWRVLCDFDGTIVLEDVIDALLERFGDPLWKHLEQQWRAGVIGSRECMQRQVELLDMDRSELDAHLDAVLIDPDFPEFVRRAHVLGIGIAIASDGLDYAISRILGRHGLDHLPVAANRLVATDSPRHWRLESPYRSAECLSGTCKCQRIDLARGAQPRSVVLIGDGASDYCAASQADYVLAKGSLIQHCRSLSIPHSPITGFGAAIELLPVLDRLAPPELGALNAARRCTG